jgi:hypothetical protein
MLRWVLYASYTIMLPVVLHGNESWRGQLLGTGRQGKYLDMGNTKYVYSELEKSN